jgi:hypothetical protein
MGLRPKLAPEVREVYDLIIAGAKMHGEEDDADHEVGDLQQALEAACAFISAVNAEVFRELCDLFMEDWLFEAEHEED